MLTGNQSESTIRFWHTFYRTITMQITVQIKSVYGRDLVYPVCCKSRAFAAIAGTDTLTEFTVNKIKSLGYKVLVEPTITEL